MVHTLRVGVFMGGRSVEKEASFNSGRTVCDHLDSTRYNIIPIFQRGDGQLFILPWSFLHRGKISDFEHRLETQAEKITWDALPRLIDFMYLATHGQFTEDGILQGFLEILNIPYLGSGILTSALCMNKVVQNKMITSHGFNVPQSIVVNPETITQLSADSTKNIILNSLLHAHISLPCIVKPQQEGSSLGITVVHNHDELWPALEHACTIQPNKPQAVLVEELLQGMEFSCIILVDYKNNTVLPLAPTEIIPDSKGFFDYEQKYMPGRATKFTPARCSQENIKNIQDVCIKLMHHLEIKTIARIDGFLMPDNRIYIIDTNTLAGMGPTSFLFRQAAELGMGHTALINHLIETELHAYGMLPQTINGEV